MSYIVDSCVWIDFFSKKMHFNAISELLVKDEIYTNSIILAELRPSAMVRRQEKFIDCISALEEIPLNINWNEIEEIQHYCIRNGINKVGLLDIAIGREAKQNEMAVFSTDKHMTFLSHFIGFDLKVE